jgi:hypothetical protein
MQWRIPHSEIYDVISRDQSYFIDGEVVKVKLEGLHSLEDIQRLAHDLSAVQDAADDNDYWRGKPWRTP